MKPACADLKTALTNGRAKTFSKMYYLDKEFSHFIMTIRASIMERDQSSNRNRNQRKYTKLNHLVQLTVIILHEE